MLQLLDQFSDQLSCTFYGRNDAYHLSDDCVRLDQVHGSRTVVCRTASLCKQQADGVCTDTKNLPLVIGAADCQNFVLYAPNHHVIGALHAGWRGLLAGAIPECISTLKEEWGIPPSELFVAAGPSLCLQCAEFSDPTSELRGIDSQFFHGRYVDLQSIANQQFFDAGISPSHLKRHPDCTRCCNEQYLSYRGVDKQAVKGGLSNFLVCYLL